MIPKLLYFGCIGRAGHCLWESQACQLSMRNPNIPGLNVALLGVLDGTFAPGMTREQGQFQESIVPPLRIVSWWDYTVDGRPGSNSSLIGYGYDSAEAMISAANLLFPSVMNRQLLPVRAVNT